MAARLFTLAEVEDMLPFLAPLLFQLRGLKADADRARKLASEIGARMRTNGHALADDLARAGEDLQKTAGKMNELVERINDMGCELKDIDRGLVDFRTTMDEREVYLCWMLGEEHVSYWHDLDAGFAGRRPLEEPRD